MKTSNNLSHTSLYESIKTFNYVTFYVVTKSTNRDKNLKRQTERVVCCLSLIFEETKIRDKQNKNSI